MKHEYSIYLTISGGGVVGDSKDEDAALLKIEFCNESSNLSDEIKLNLLWEIRKELWRIMNNESPKRGGHNAPILM